MLRHFHLGVADSDALFVGARVEQNTRTFDPALVVVRDNQLDDGETIRQQAGQRQFCVMSQNMRCSILFHLDVPGG